MKQVFEKPEFKAVLFKEENVVTSSGNYEQKVRSSMERKGVTSANLAEQSYSYLQFK